MCRKAFIVYAVAAILFTGTALAEEILHFTNGTTMAVRSHTIEEDMIKVDLGGNSFMAFPMSQIDRIEKAGQNVYVSPSTKLNQMFDSPDAKYPIQGRRPAAATGQAIREKPQFATEDIDVAPNGVVGQAPFASSEHPAKQKVRVTGTRGARARLYNDRASGSGRVIPATSGNQARTARRAARTGISLKSSPAPKKKSGDSGSDK